VIVHFAYNGGIVKVHFAYNGGIVNHDC